ncbi:DMT family transporter [Aquabacterium sp. OR-4]|uniref:DMT family transporter n=1 Tax=Aquabacterium sp. OR-4 TaxID=2978127 RepID=UPI0021B4A378|nr:DMT family transporter [Aquabacterium sp. OR-4]MDT7834735.1 DMT family transporter [Aquabacterium sp. OR-4]
MTLNHSRAVALMLLITLMWSIAGVVSRHFEAARGFEVTFWRSAFNVLALVVVLGALRGRALWRDLRHGGWPLWASGLCWMVMYTNFMLAITMTTVATVLITMSIAPLLTALFSRVFLRHAMPLRTWLAIAVAGAGIAWMFGSQALAQNAGGGSMAGALVALGVPIAGASNFTLLQWLHQRHAADPAVAEPEMLPAVLIGALLSALLTLPMALPFQATGHDLSLLAMLGLVQLAIPCLLVVRVAKVLPAPEISLLGLLEVIFGVLWAWLGAGEAPGATALQGGALVIGALLANEAVALRGRRLAAQPVPTA